MAQETTQNHNVNGNSKDKCWSPQASDSNYFHQFKIKRVRN